MVTSQAIILYTTSTTILLQLKCCYLHHSCSMHLTVKNVAWQLRTLYVIRAKGLLLKVKVEVYSLVSSTKHYSPNFTQLPPGNRTCSFISHLNSPGSIQPGCHFWHTELFKHTSLHCPARYPLTPGLRDSAHVGKVPCLGAQHWSIIQPSWGLNLQGCQFSGNSQNSGFSFFWTWE